MCKLQIQLAITLKYFNCLILVFIIIINMLICDIYNTSTS